jgi:hypothetical protein
MCRKRVTVRGLLILTAVIAFGLGIWRFVDWLRYPHVDVTIFNEGTVPISDVQLNFPFGLRTAKCIPPGGVATAVIQNEEEGVFLSYRNANGIRVHAKPVYAYIDNHGWIEYHVVDDIVTIAQDL